MNAIALDTVNEINRLDQLARTTASEAVELARQAGLLLLQVKEQLPHGQFSQWVSTNTVISQRQAQRYMAVAQGKALSLKADNLKCDTVSHLKEKSELSKGLWKGDQWIPEAGYQYLLNDDDGGVYWVLPSTYPVGGFHICKHYSGERLTSKDYYLKYTILSEVHNTQPVYEEPVTEEPIYIELVNPYYIGTRKPVCIGFSVNNVLKTYGLTLRKESFIIGMKCAEGFDRPFGEPEPQHWYWDVRHPVDVAFLQDLDKDGHINAHGAIVLDWREHQANSQQQVG